MAMILLRDSCYAAHALTTGESKKTGRVRAPSIGLEHSASCFYGLVMKVSNAEMPNHE